MENERKNNGGLIAIIIILIIAVLGLAGYLVYDKVIKKDGEKNNSTSQNNTQESVNNGTTQQGNTQESVNSNNTNNNDTIAGEWKKFQVKDVKIDYISANNVQFKTYDVNNNLIHESKKYNSLKIVNGITGIAVIDDKTLRIIDYEENNIADLATLANTNYKISEAKNISTSDTSCTVSKNGTYVFVSNGLKGNDEKLFAIYYNLGTKEKSELVEFDGISYGNLVNCK